MTKQEFEEKSNMLVTEMKKQNYSEYVIRETLVWMKVIKKEHLEEAFMHLLKKLDEKPTEEKYRKELYEYCDTVRIVHTEEEKRQMYKEIIRRRSQK